MPTDATLRILIVGAGRLGATLARDLLAAGHQVAVVSRRPQRTAQLQAWAPTLTIYADLPAAAGSWDAVLAAVADRALGELAATLAANTTVTAPVWLHCSGVASSTALAHPRATAALGSLHPLAAVADPLQVQVLPSPLQGALMAIAGDAAAVRVAEAIARDLKGLPCHVPDAARPGYHAAAALIANDWVALAHAAEQAAITAGLPSDVARAGLLHLAETALQALRRVPARDPLVYGLTGAVSRGDGDTLLRHLAVLQGDPNAAAQHRLASLRLAAACLAAGVLTEAQVAVLHQQLDDDNPSSRPA